MTVIYYIVYHVNRDSHNWRESLSILGVFSLGKAFPYETSLKTYQLINPS